MLKPLIFTTAIIFCSAACKNTATPEPPQPSAPSKMVGGDQDAHGCKASAGYTWSALRQECIRIFETGIRLNPKAGQDATLSAFAVFKTPDMDGDAELFLPGRSESLLLHRIADNGAGTWAVDTFTLRQWKGVLTVEGKSGVSLYEGAVSF